MINYFVGVEEASIAYVKYLSKATCVCVFISKRDPRSTFVYILSERESLYTYFSNPQAGTSAAICIHDAYNNWRERELLCVCVSVWCGAQADPDPRGETGCFVVVVVVVAKSI